MSRPEDADKKKQIAIWLPEDVHRRLTHFKIDSGSASLDQVVAKVLDERLPLYPKPDNR